MTYVDEVTPRMMLGTRNRFLTDVRNTKTQLRIMPTIATDIVYTPSLRLTIYRNNTTHATSDQGTIHGSRREYGGTQRTPVPTLMC